MTIQELLIYWRVIKRRLWLIGLLVVVTLGVIVLTSYLAKPLYRASASFQVTAPLPAEVSLFSEYKNPLSEDELIRTKNSFAAVLQSEFVIGQAIEELGLDMEVDEFIGQMLIEPDEHSDFIKLHLTAHDPKLAAGMANTLMDKATHYFGELSAGAITANREFIQQQVQDVKEALDEARADLIQFQVENRIGSLSGFLESQETLVTRLKTSRDQALAEGKEATAASYDEIIADREQELQELVVLSAEYEFLKVTVDRIESTYAGLLAKETEADLKENEVLTARFVQVIPAREPSRPLPRLNVKVLVLGGIVSVAVGVMIAFILEYSDRITTAASGEEAAAGQVALAPSQR
jgi:uncharacterized protein involved in exopolysaccharide biosynthesis